MLVDMMIILMPLAINIVAFFILFYFIQFLAKLLPTQEIRPANLDDIVKILFIIMIILVLKK